MSLTMKKFKVHSGASTSYMNRKRQRIVSILGAYNREYYGILMFRPSLKGH